MHLFLAALTHSPIPQVLVFRNVISLTIRVRPPMASENNNVTSMLWVLAGISVILAALLFFFG